MGSADPLGTWKKEWLMAGLLTGGIGTIFYVVLLIGMGVTKLWRWGQGWIQRIGNM